MRFRSWALAVAAAFAFLYFTEAVIELDFNLDPFQVATGYLKDRNPDLFPRDFIWGKAEMTRNLHVCVRGLMRFTMASRGMPCIRRTLTAVPLRIAFRSAM